MAKTSSYYKKNPKAAAGGRIVFGDVAAGWRVDDRGG